jgi:hypothetical protein
MATYRAISTGVASALARWEVWNGAAWVAATVLPTVADDVYANNFTVTLDVNFFASSYRNGSLGIGVNANGSFNLNGGITIVGDVINDATVNSVVCMTFASGTSYIVGNIYGSAATGGTSRHGVLQTGGVLTITGSGYARGLSGGNITQRPCAVVSNAGSCVITGSAFATAQNNSCAVASGGGAITIQGTAVGQASGQLAASGCLVNQLQAGNDGCVVYGKFIMPTTNQPVWTNCKAQTGANVQIEIYNELNQPVLCNPLFAQDQADPADVRNATVYANGALTGTCAVPPAASVALNVPVDNTVGSLATSAVVAADLLNEMNTSNLTIAQGLRDGMGASAAAIAAVGSINVIP